MRLLLIFWYDNLDDYAFYDGKRFFMYDEKGRTYDILYSPSFEFIDVWDAFTLVGDG